MWESFEESAFLSLAPLELFNFGDYLNLQLTLD